MHDETDEFWQDLLTRLDPAEAPPNLTVEEAEERMASAGSTPFSEAEIEAIVSSATAEDPAPEQRGFVTRFRTLAKLAALVVGLLLLYSVAQLFRPNPAPQRFEYTTAIDLLINPETGKERRLSSLGRVFDFSLFGIQTLKRVLGEGGELQSDAERHLADLRQVLESEEMFSPYEPDQPMDDLAALILDDENSWDQRHTWMENLAEQTRSAILAVMTTRTGDEESELNRFGRIYLDRLDRELEY